MFGVGWSYFCYGFGRGLLMFGFSCSQSWVFRLFLCGFVGFDPYLYTQCALQLLRVCDLSCESCPLRLVPFTPAKPQGSPRAGISAAVCVPSRLRLVAAHIDADDLTA